MYCFASASPGVCPGSYRFSVGDRLVQSVLDVLLRLVDAAYSRDKPTILTEVNGMLNASNIRRAPARW